VNPTNIHRDYGWSSSNQRNRFSFQSVWQPAIRSSGVLKQVVTGWIMAPNFIAGSAFPVSPITGTDVNGEGVNNDFPIFRTRNDVRGFGFKELNLRISRTFPVLSERLRLELIGEAENLLNSTNAACNAAGCTGAVGNTVGARNYLQIVQAFNSRQIQIGGRLRF